MSEWISVKTELPETSKFERSRRINCSDLVLIWWIQAGEDDNFLRIPAASMGTYNHNTEEWRPVGCMGYFNDQITHWQPLPSPPK